MVININPLNIILKKKELYRKNSFEKLSNLDFKFI